MGVCWSKLESYIVTKNKKSEVRKCIEMKRNCWRFFLRTLLIVCKMFRGLLPIKWNMAILLFRSTNANLPTSNDDYFGLRMSTPTTVVTWLNSGLDKFDSSFSRLVIGFLW